MNLVLNIRGGLGNQLFQYGMMRYLNIKYPESKMSIDSRVYQKFKLRDFELRSFKLFDNIEDYNDTPLLYSLSWKTYHVYQYLYRRFFTFQAPQLSDFFVRRGLIYGTIDYNIPVLPNCDRTYYMYGYFGVVRYINEIRSVLIDDLKLKNSLSPKAMQFDKMISECTNPVGVSIRYGADYKEYGWPICTPDYYRSGMDKLLKERKKCKFFIFSDVLDEVIKEHWFEGYDVEYVSGCSTVESFALLKSCNDFVIANSTFSWWASWLGEHPNKIVYAPNYFYSEMYRHKYDELMIFKEEKFLDYKTGEETDSPKFLG